MKSEALDRGMGTGDEGSQSGMVSGTSQGQTGLGGRASPDSPSQVARDAGFLSGSVILMRSRAALGS